MHTEWTFLTAQMYLMHALCLRRRGVSSRSVAGVDGAAASLETVLSDVLPELLQFIPHRTVRIEKGESFYSDEAKSKVLSIAHVKNVSDYSIHSMKHKRLELLGWKLDTCQFRGVNDKVSGGTIFTVVLELLYIPTGDMRHRATVTYTISEVGRSSVPSPTAWGVQAEGLRAPSLEQSTTGRHERKEGGGRISSKRGGSSQEWW